MIVAGLDSLGSVRGALPAAAFGPDAAIVRVVATRDPDGQEVLDPAGDAPPTYATEYAR